MKKLIQELFRQKLLERQDEGNVKEINDIFERFVVNFKSGMYTVHKHGSGAPYIAISVNIPKEDIKFKAVADYIIITIQNIKHFDMGKRGMRPVKGFYVLSKNGVPIINIFEAGIEFNESQTGILNADEVVKINEAAIKHELTHFIDEVMKGRPLDTIEKIKKKTQGDNEYGFVPSESNALILSFLASVKKVPDTFEKFIEDFVNFGKNQNDRSYETLLSNPDEKKRKALIGRLYQYYMSFKNKEVIRDEPSKSDDKDFKSLSSDDKIKHIIQLIYNKKDTGDKLNSLSKDEMDKLETMRKFLGI
jgi:hypothetical protein